MESEAREDGFPLIVYPISQVIAIQEAAQAQAQQQVIAT
jgi:hypothetical protein